MTVRIEAGYGI